MCEQNFLVQVTCMTYNHVNYITDAMNGFAMQQTSFPFVCIIVDDASTDGEPDVIKKYLDDNFDKREIGLATEDETDEYLRIYAQHKENKNCYFCVLLLKYNHYSIKKPKTKNLAGFTKTIEYIAVCEGDDYWTDPLKLQRQVDFLETHPDFSLCCHRFKRYYESTGSWDDDYVGKAFAEHPDVEGLVVSNLENMHTRFTWTLTLCYRKAVADAIEWHPYVFGKRDFTLHYHLLKAGKGWCFADFMGVYRVNSGGIWQGMSPLEKDRFRLEGYDDFYSYHKDDKDVLVCYLDWLERFYQDHALSVFSRHRITKKGIRSMGFAAKHYWKLKGPRVAINKCYQCVKAFLRSIKAK